MAVTEGFSQYVQEQLERVMPVTLRRMFGGIGIYSRGFFFALMDNDTLFLKVDGTSRADFEERGMGPFRPFGDDRMSMQYYEVPAEILEDAELLRSWVRKSVSAAMRKSAAKRPRRRLVAGATGKLSAKSKARARGTRRAKGKTRSGVRAREKASGRQDKSGRQAERKGRSGTKG